MLLIVNIGFAQSKFDKGFNDGYNNGYCQDQGIGCLSPIPPIAPIPKIGENLDSYIDGYNRGFKTGLNDRINNDKNNYRPRTRERYKTAKPEFIDYAYKPNYDLLLKIAELEAKTEPLRRKVFKDNLDEIVKKFNQGNYYEVINLGVSTIEYTKFSSSDLNYMIGVSYYMADKKIKAEPYLKQASKKGHQNSKKMLDLMRKERGKIKYSATGGYEKSSHSDNANSFYAGILLDVPVAYNKKWGIVTEILYSSNGPIIFTSTNESSDFSSTYINLLGYRAIKNNIKLLGGFYSSFNFERETTNFGFATGLKIDVSKTFYLQGKYLKRFYEGSAFLDGNETEINYPDNTIQVGIGVNIN